VELVYSLSWNGTQPVVELVLHHQQHKPSAVTGLCKQSITCHAAEHNISTSQPHIANYATVACCDSSNAIGFGMCMPMATKLLLSLMGHRELHAAASLVHGVGCGQACGLHLFHVSFGLTRGCAATCYLKSGACAHSHYQHFHVIIMTPIHYIHSLHPWISTQSEFVALLHGLLLTWSCSSTAILNLKQSAELCCNTHIPCRAVSHCLWHYCHHILNECATQP
jgi:hypothetical protein